MNLEIIIATIIGSLLGCIGTHLLQFFNYAHGVLRIDHSNPEKVLYRFEIDDLSMLNGKDYVELKIDHNADLSRK